MAETYGYKVRDLLPDRFDGIDAVVAGELKDAQEGRASLPGIALKMAGDKATGAIKDALDCDVFQILANAWCKARELHEYTDAKTHPPEETNSVFLGDHKLAASVHPILDLSVAAIGRAKLRFTVEVSAKFKSADLTIRGGRITGIAAGECWATAQLKYGSAKLHNELASKHMKLAGPITLPAPGLQIV
jgi:hypothetical protein